VPANITIVAQPPKCPELNSVSLGTSSSISPGASCLSDCAKGRIGSEQWELVLAEHQRNGANNQLGAARALAFVRERSFVTE